MPEPVSGLDWTRATPEVRNKEELLDALGNVFFSPTGRRDILPGIIEQLVAINQTSLAENLLQTIVDDHPLIMGQEKTNDKTAHPTEIARQKSYFFIMGLALQHDLPNGIFKDDKFRGTIPYSFMNFALHNSPKCVRRMLECGIIDANSPIEFNIDRPFSMKTQIPRLISPLSVALDLNRWETVSTGDNPPEDIIKNDHVNEEVIEILLEFGANPNLKFNDEKMDTAISQAFFLDRFSVIPKLIEAGATDCAWLTTDIDFADIPPILYTWIQRENPDAQAVVDLLLSKDIEEQMHVMNFIKDHFASTPAFENDGTGVALIAYMESFALKQKHQDGLTKERKSGL